MTPGPTIFQRAKRPLNVLAGGIFLSLALVFGSVYLRDSLKKSLAQSQSRLGAQQSSLVVKQQDLINVQAHIEQFRSLREQGLVGSADREGWVEQLVASREQLNLPNTLSYTLKPAQPLIDPATSNAAAPSPVATAPDAENSDVVLTHDMDFELSSIHEAELVDFLHHYRSRVHGRFRVQVCHLGSPTPAGLFAQCTLRFFTLPESAKPP